MRPLPEFKFACLPGGGRKRNPSPAKFFLAPISSKNQKRKSTRNLPQSLSYTCDPFSPLPNSTSTNLYYELAGNLYNPPPSTSTNLYNYFFRAPPFFRNPFCTTQYPTSTVSPFFSQPRLLKSELPPIRRTKKAPFFVCREPALNFDLGKETQSRPGPARPPAARHSNCRFKNVCLRDPRGSRSGMMGG